ncbi:MAG: hypothetical protein AVDCRST_MAG96-3370 [uncultured Segetibacter sp.]|uniref:Uncharacterized protein n=1 Tax=uncultured Segetibacter sp. TaxID=481133 RepID=A0A6J4TP17_9BACT|nr:MAG: hypothetical protein AVDCRST_MAG96-3370 [uncultured Segetibacter sp.]
MKRIIVKLVAFFLVKALAPFDTSAQLKIGDQPTLARKAVALDVQGSGGLQGLWLPRVTDTSIAGIRSLNPPDGLIIYHPPSGKLFVRSNNSWVSYLSQAITTISSTGQAVAGPDVTFQTGTAAGTSNDFNIAANSAANTMTFNIPDASPTARGAVTAGAQTIGGSKTFANGLTVNGAAGATSNLTLGVNAATTPAAVSDKYLSVDGTGNVTLNAITVITNRQIRIKSYIKDLDGLPINLNNNDVSRFTITIPGANLSSTSTVIINPLTAFKPGTRIDFVKVFDLNTIEINISTLGTSQPLTSGNAGSFNITVIEF